MSSPGQHGALDQRSGNLSAQDKSLRLCGSLVRVDSSVWQAARCEVERVIDVPAMKAVNGSTDGFERQWRAVCFRTPALPFARLVQGVQLSRGIGDSTFDRDTPITLLQAPPHWYSLGSGRKKIRR